jgi:uncharacterized coiled-coil DUF342 family protein
MPQETEKKEEILYRADPFTFVFRELDLLHAQVREIKGELAIINKRFDDVNKRFDDVNRRFDDVNKRFDDVNKRFDDVNKRFDDVNKRFDDINKRIDRLYLFVIINLIGIVAFLIKAFFF